MRSWRGTGIPHRPPILHQFYIFKFLKQYIKITVKIVFLVYKVELFNILIFVSLDVEFKFDIFLINLKHDSKHLVYFLAF